MPSAAAPPPPPPAPAPTAEGGRLVTAPPGGTDQGTGPANDSPVLDPRLLPAFTLRGPGSAPIGDDLDPMAHEAWLHQARQELLQRVARRGAPGDASYVFARCRAATGWPTARPFEVRPEGADVLPRLLADPAVTRAFRHELAEHATADLCAQLAGRVPEPGPWASGQCVASAMAGGQWGLSAAPRAQLWAGWEFWRSRHADMTDVLVHVLLADPELDAAGAERLLRCALSGPRLGLLLHPLVPAARWTEQLVRVANDPHGLELLAGLLGSPRAGEVETAHLEAMYREADRSLLGDLPQHVARHASDSLWAEFVLVRPRHGSGIQLSPEVLHRLRPWSAAALEPAARARLLAHPRREVRLAALEAFGRPQPDPARVQAGGPGPRR